MDAIKANELFDRLVSHPSGELANDVLPAFYHGLPVSRVKELYGSKDPYLVGIGAFLAAELGSKARELLPDMPGLLSNPDLSVVYDAISTILVCASKENGHEIAHVLCLLESRPDLRSVVLDFLWRASDEQIAAGLTQDDIIPRCSVVRKWLEWLTNSSGKDMFEIETQSESGDPWAEQFSLIAAAKLATRCRKILKKRRADLPEDARHFTDSVLSSLSVESPAPRLPHVDSK